MCSVCGGVRLRMLLLLLLKECSRKVSLMLLLLMIPILIFNRVQQREIEGKLT